MKSKSKNKKKISILHYFFPIVIGFLILISMNLEIGNQKEPQLLVLKEEPVVEEVEVVEKEPGIDIERLQREYNNSDIIGYIVIPDVVSYPIVKANNNTFYLNHSLDGSKNIKGSPFMDYRVNFEDRKILIYGHSGVQQDLPFLQLHKYDNESFYKEHPTIYLYSIDKKYTYEIFSVYLEPSDYDYVNINSFRGLTWKQHIEKLKSKSYYNIPITLTDESKILVLQTCYEDGNTNGGKYKLVIGVLTNIEVNNK